MDTRQLNDVLKIAIEETNNLEQKDLVRFGKKWYAPVKIRNDIFRKHFGMDAGYTSTYEIVQPYSYKVLKQGKEVTLYFPGSVICKTEIFYKNKFLATGIAEEIRGSSHVNTTSALENAQTSSLGRALTMIGISGNEFASADEMAGVERKEKSNDIANQDAPPSDAGSKTKNKTLITKEDLRQLISAAKHLGDLNKILMNHDTLLQEHKDLNDLFAKEKKRMEEGTPKTKEDDEDWYG
tara:strand:- start:787 stop:1500 length:714 start_codon:yes stop_codon:yes gene_type:complete